MWPAATCAVPTRTHLPVTHVLPKDQLWFVAARLVRGDIMILSHIRLIGHAPFASVLLTGSASEMQQSASVSLLSNTSDVPALGGHCVFTCCHVHTKKYAFGYLSHIACFKAALIGTLPLVLICMISTGHPLFMFSPHTTFFFSRF